MNRHHDQSVDTVLDEAHVLDNEYSDFNTSASLDRIARRALRSTASALEDQARRARHGTATATSSAPGEEPAAAPPAAEHDKAGQRLEMLATLIVRDHGAVRAMSRLVDDASIDPAGALVFACLLYLADRGDGAQFWWQFAAGAAGTAGAAAAGCLVLHHMQHAEPRTALYWQHQIHTLRGAADCRPPDYPVRLAGPGEASTYYLPETPEACVAALLHLTPQRRDEAGRWWVGTSPLGEAVRRLPVTPDDEYGEIPRPDPKLADELAAQGAP